MRWNKLMKKINNAISLNFIYHNFISIKGLEASGENLLSWQQARGCDRSIRKSSKMVIR